MKTRALAAAVLAVLTANTSGAQSPGERASMPERPSIVSQILAATPASGDPTARQRGLAHQIAPMAGREDLAIDIASLLPSCPPGGSEAVAEIVRRARDTSIVIINEEHGSPQHRHFVGQVLEALRPEGYSVYAAEAFISRPDVSASDLTRGYYTNDPVFGRVARRAQAMGYELVGYEIRPDQIDRTNTAVLQVSTREQAQADNLVEAVFRDRPDARAVIHVGFDHVFERVSDGGEEWMAARLKRATGVDPLTVSQTACAAQGASSMATAMPVDGAHENIARAKVDLIVGHPPLVFERHRPTWRRDAGDIVLDIPAALLPEDEMVIVEARPAGGGIADVPVDRILVRTGERPPLLLPPGRYRLDAFTSAGRVKSEPVVVEARE